MTLLSWKKMVDQPNLNFSGLKLFRSTQNAVLSKPKKKKDALAEFLDPKTPKNRYLGAKRPKMGHFGAKNAKNREALPIHG